MGRVITDIKDPLGKVVQRFWHSCFGSFTNLTKSGNDITGAEFTDSDVQALRRKHPATIKDSETKLAAVSLINLILMMKTKNCCRSSSC